MEIFPNGFGETWFVDRARDEIDPERIVPSVEEFATHGWNTAFADINRVAHCLEERLADCTTAACFVEGVSPSIQMNGMAVPGGVMVSMFAADD